MKRTILKLTLFAIIGYFTVSCGGGSIAPPINYHVVIHYYNGDIDTLNITGYGEGIGLSSVGGGAISAGHDSCLEVAMGLKTKKVACNVRRFEILSKNGVSY